jgi:hypothetical protein
MSQTWKSIWDGSELDKVFENCGLYYEDFYDVTPPADGASPGLPPDVGGNRFQGRR